MKLAVLGVGVLLAGGTDPVNFLDVIVSNVRNANGHVLVAVCLPAEFLSRQCQFVASAPAHAGTLTVRVEGIRPGTYAVQVFQDENDNLDIDRSFFGIPTEGIGFSNDVSFNFGPPDFQAAAVSLGLGGQTITVSLRYFN